MDKGKEIQAKDEKQFASEREIVLTEVKFKQDKEGNLKKATLLTSKGQKITYSGKEYTTEVTELNGIPDEQDVTKTKTKAEVKRKNFLDDLKFVVGDLVVFKYTEYSSRERKNIGKIVEIEYSGKPYKIMGIYKECENISD